MTKTEKDEENTETWGETLKDEENTEKYEPFRHNQGNQQV